MTPHFFINLPLVPLILQKRGEELRTTSVFRVCSRLPEYLSAEEERGLMSDRSQTPQGSGIREAQGPHAEGPEGHALSSDESRVRSACEAWQGDGGAVPSWHLVFSPLRIQAVLRCPWLLL